MASFGGTWRFCKWPFSGQFLLLVFSVVYCATVFGQDNMDTNTYTSNYNPNNYETNNQILDSPQQMVSGQDGNFVGGVQPAVQLNSGLYQNGQLNYAMTPQINYALNGQEPQLNYGGQAMPQLSFAINQGIQPNLPGGQLYPQYQSNPIFQQQQQQQQQQPQRPVTRPARNKTRSGFRRMLSRITKAIMTSPLATEAMQMLEDGNNFVRESRVPLTYMFMGALYLDMMLAHNPPRDPDASGRRPRQADPVTTARPPAPAASRPESGGFHFSTPLGSLEVVQNSFMDYVRLNPIFWMKKMKPLFNSLTKM